MEYSQALSFLAGLRRFGMRPGLEAVTRLAEAVGVRWERQRFIHVAGTNGKGSTCAFLEAIYRCAGYRVGLYTSPHLVSVRERVQVDRAPIPEPALGACVGAVSRAASEFPGEEHPTFFEVLTVVALQWFAENRCDLVVWETGLGGRLDATNIVRPLASVITNIGWDHMQWLGDSLAAIAREKAGIIKPGVPVLTAAGDPEARSVLAATARERGAPFRRVTLSDPDLAWLRAETLPLTGEHQAINAALATAVVGQLQAILPVGEAALRLGLGRTRWAGRFEVRPLGQGRLVLDGAHNLPAFEVLAATLAQQFPGERYALVLGLLADKDAVGAVRVLVPGAAKVVVVPVHTGRGGDPDVLAALCAGAGGTSRVERAPDVGAALRRLAGESLVVVTGSLYLVGEVLELLSPGTTSERELNDWSPIR